MFGLTRRLILESLEKCRVRAAVTLSTNDNSAAALTRCCHDPYRGQSHALRPGEGMHTAMMQGYVLRCICDAVLNTYGYQSPAILRCQRTFFAELTLASGEGPRRPDGSRFDTALCNQDPDDLHGNYQT